MTSVLSLDLSTHVGWCYFAGPADPAPQLGTFVLPKCLPGTYGRRLAAFEEWLEGRFHLLSPLVFSIEAPVFARVSADQTTNEQAMRLQLALAGVAELIAHRRRVRMIEAHFLTVKKALSGNARAKKPEMIRAAIERGFAPADEHQADAIGVALATFNHLA